MLKTINSKVLFVMMLFILSLSIVIGAAFIATDTQNQHIMLTDLLTSQELFVERVTFRTISIGETVNLDLYVFERRLKENKALILEERDQVDRMLEAFERRMFITADGREKRLKFRDDFLKLLDDAINKTQNEWNLAKSDMDFLLQIESTNDLEAYNIVLRRLESSNKTLVENAAYITFLCREEADRRKNLSYGIEFGSMVLSLGIFVYWRIFFGKHFYKPIMEIKNVFNQMSKGEINHYLQRDEEDEFKELYNAFNYFVENLNFLFKLEDQILLENRLNEILEFIYTDFKGFIEFEKLGIVFRDRDGIIKERIFEGEEINEAIISGLDYEEIHTVQKKDGRILTPLRIGDVYLGYVYFECLDGSMGDTDLNFLNLIHNKIALAFYKSFLFKDLLAIVTESLAKMAESRDPETGLHLERMSSYSQIITRKLYEKGLYTDEIDLQFIEEIKICAPMHDIGKVHVPDHILLKPGKLTETEFEIMKTHASEGGKILDGIHSRFKDFGIHYFKMASDIAYGHQEKFNGSGYPRGLKEDEIPLSARIATLADVFDALTTKRPYKDAFSLERSYQIISESRGAHFQPEIVDAFFEAKKEIESIYNRFKEV